MNQLKLFTQAKIDTSDLLDLAIKNPTLCYSTLRKREMQIPASIWFIVEKNLKTDWLKLHDEFELNGFMTFVNVKINDTQIRFFEQDMELFMQINDGDYLKLYTCTENDIYDNKYKAKIKGKLKQFIDSKAFQFNLK